ncbi:Vta1p SKDI_12G2180 [Saccharomyces kudriavzevii IFO 1802]|uniref:VTA1-like protein n=2 Tax=Saccharomyces kudriavzevii (strain ATCC MYA-4449 / AS 2.2408 / CBS 8840 / NBRC 1802 / NCYC 2889) TaxID=226230 RepID=J5S6G6_SACK1|nr:uncharacterized protein SKDI_12G2180 [Saccharomyces kudriavzevii IFO 1802]EJT43966.1 VTA1-like protein [Saccharomyces kudriavzevii IFO 1802]CAI4046295.1 hypothetical protein SKDI_12G2180 [Saccharomyces kudriavzevii IFO 1802]
MSVTNSATRVVATAKDFDKVGLGIIGYYLQLYAVELILSEDERSQDMTALAVELLDTIEGFKKEVGGESQAENSDKGVQVMNTLIHDQEKSKIYMLNFTMSLYNEKLKQLKDGPWDVMLKRSLWCCIDLFSCILHLWKENISETSVSSLEKRIKYCKLYLSKLAKGEIGSTDKEKLDYSDFIDDNEEARDEEVGDLINDLKTSDDFKGDDLTTEGQGKSDEPVDEVPEFIDDSDNSSEEERSPDKCEGAIKQDQEPENKGELSPIHSSTPPAPPAPAHKSYTKDELTKIMDRSSKIEQIQKYAKYAISALNYEDLPTAKDELTKALGLLDSI